MISLETVTAKPERGRKPGEVPPTDPIIRGWRGASLHSGKSIPQLKRDVKAKRFPAPLEIETKSLGWRKSWIDEWLASRPRRLYTAAA
jgi:predicted DNA-binding transcriptional regulator AlpA